MVGLLGGRVSTDTFLVNNDHTRRPGVPVLTTLVRRGVLILLAKGLGPRSADEIVTVMRLIFWSPRRSTEERHSIQSIR